MAVTVQQYSESWTTCPLLLRILSKLICWDAQKLHAIAKSMCGKAPGPDDWQAEGLCALPMTWWQAFTSLWSCVYRSGHVLASWCRAKLALIPKKGDRTRPISLCVIAWRIGARFICRGLRSWISSWANHHDLGGGPGCSVLHAHLRIHNAMLDGVDTFVQQVLSHFFDSIDVDFAERVLTHLQAPPDLGVLLKSFYGQAQRIFSHKGFVANSWRAPSRGVIQGCPLSPLVAMCIMHCWAQHICQQVIGVDAIAYIDNRTLWSLSSTGDQVQLLSNALEQSRAFDLAFGFKCDGSMCSVASASVSADVCDLAVRLDYRLTTTLEALGVAHDLCCISRKNLLKFTAQKAQVRLKFVKAVPGSMRQKLQHIFLFGATSCDMGSWFCRT